MNLDSAGFFRSDAGTQILNRGALTEVLPYSDGTDEQRARWANLVAALETDLRLLSHPPGTLARPGMAQYLFERTGGSIAALTSLIQLAAVHAAYEGRSGTGTGDMAPPERITKSLLKTVPSTAAAEMRAQAVNPSKRAKVRKARHR